MGIYSPAFFKFKKNSLALYILKLKCRNNIITLLIEYIFHY